jgi:hypothetical protein
MDTVLVVLLVINAIFAVTNGWTLASGNGTALNAFALGLNVSAVILMIISLSS